MRRTKEEWSEIVGSYHASGLSLRQFCRTENIGEQSLRNWTKRTMRGSGTRSNVEHGFVEVRSASNAGRRVSCKEQVRDPAFQRGALIIRFRDDTVIEVQPDTDRHTLAWVLALLANR
jgi:transposase-like protein